MIKRLPLSSSPPLPSDPTSQYSPWLVTRPLRPRLTESIETDFVVVGGGLGGVVAASGLIERGERAILIEAGVLGGRGTGTTTGIVSEACASEGSALEMLKLHGRDRTVELFSEVWRGIARLRELIDRSEQGVDLREDGYLHLHSDIPGCEALHQAIESLGMSARLLEGEEVQRFADSPFYRAAILLSESKRNFVFNPYLLTQNTASTLEKKGLRIFEDTPALSVEPHERGVRVVTPMGELVARRVILAVNPFLFNFPGVPRAIRRSVAPVFQHVSLIEFAGRSPVSGCSGFADNEKLDYAFGNVLGNRMMISAGNFEFVCSHEATGLQAAEAANVRLVRERFKGYEFKVLSTWGGRIGGALSRGFLPQGGFIDRSRKVYLAAVGDGLAWAARLGDLAAECVSRDIDPPEYLRVGANHTLSTFAATLLPVSLFERLAPLVYRFS